MAKENTRIQETNTNTAPANSVTEAPGSTVEVLYQKMGDRWFAFSLIDDEVFVGSITQEEIDETTAQTALNPRAGSA